MGNDYPPSPSEQHVITALDFIVPILDELKLTWWITGGFACYVYGVARPLTDIDIDVGCGVKDPRFVALLERLAPFITFPLQHLYDDCYDSYNVEATYNDVILDLCPADDLNLRDSVTKRYEPAYPQGHPEPDIKSFHNFQLPLLPKANIIIDKQRLQRDMDLTDIAALKNLI